MSATALEQLVARARACGRIGLVPEFIGEGRYLTMLCVIQLVVSDDEGLEVVVLDALDDGLDLASARRTLLADPQITVVVHAGRQDVALLRRVAQTEVNAIFDTQIAAGFAGLSAQAAYDTLLRELLGVRVQKTASYTRWDRRPLDAEQLAYAREDVLHLLDLAAQLERRLRACRADWTWALEECHASSEAVKRRARPRHDLRAVAADQLARRLERAGDRPRSSSAGGRQLRPARSSKDRPSAHGPQRRRARREQVAKRCAPGSMEQLEQIRGVNPGSLRRRGCRPARHDRRGALHCRPGSRSRSSGTSRSNPPRRAAQIALAEAFVRAGARARGGPGLRADRRPRRPVGDRRQQPGPDARSRTCAR